MTFPPLNNYRINKQFPFSPCTSYLDVIRRLRCSWKCSVGSRGRNPLESPPPPHCIQNTFCFADFAAKRCRIPLSHRQNCRMPLRVYPELILTTYASNEIVSLSDKTCCGDARGRKREADRNRSAVVAKKNCTEANTSLP